MIVPEFENENQEADWWFANRELLGQEFEKAAAEGRLGRGTVKRRMAVAETRKEKLLHTKRPPSSAEDALSPPEDCAQGSATHGNS